MRFGKKREIGLRRKAERNSGKGCDGRNYRGGKVQVRKEKRERDHMRDRDSNKP